MATSGSADFTLTCKEMVREAAEMAGILSGDEAVSQTLLDTATRTLNIIVKSLQNEHIHLWTEEWVTKTFTASSSVTGTDGLYYRCIRSHTSAASNRPITGANWSTYWILDSTASGGTWATATAYASIGDFDVASDTIDMSNAFIRDGSNDYPLEILSIEKYLAIMAKGNTGRPSSLTLHKALTPKAYLYYQPNDTDMVLHYLRVRKLEDFDSGSNNADFPVRWLEFLTTELAYKLTFKFPSKQDPNVALATRSALKKDAETAKLKAKGNDRETTDSDFIEGAY